MLKLTNTLSGKKEAFESLRPKEVRMYHCGPTVKEPIDISKFRSYLLADVLRRKLELDGYSVTQVMNITDVGHLNEFEEDIIEIAAARTGMHAGELIEKEEKLFHEDRKAINIADAQHYPRAREHISDMIAMIEKIDQRGYAYHADGNVYLDSSKVQGLGRLTKKGKDELEKQLQSLRTPSHPGKRHVLDIDLWRTDVDHQRHWPSPWGRGFPGWHVECVAMAQKYLGAPFDIHTGAHDNVFPHHECEIVEAEALVGELLARYWLHSGEVRVDGQPMSLKSRNIVTVHELIHDGFRGAVVRLVLLSAPYGSVLDVNESSFDTAREQANAFIGFHEYLVEEAQGNPADADSETANWIRETDAAFVSALDDDLNYPAALSAVVDTINRLEPDHVGPPAQALAAVERWDSVLGLAE